MKQLAVITTARADLFEAGAVDSLFTPLFLASDSELVDPAGNMIGLESVLGSPCVALVGWSDADSGRLEAVQRRLIAAKAAIVPDIVILEDEPSWDAMMVGVAHCVERFILLQAKLIGQQTRDLLVLRRAHDSLQESFSALERYLTDRAVPMLDEAFSCEPLLPLAAADLKPTAKAPAYRQYLPVATKTLGAVSIHVAEADPAATGTLVAEIMVPELDTTISSWRIPFAFLQRGWTTLGLERTSGGLPKTAHLTLRSEGDAGRTKLSLGAVNPLPLFQFSTAAGKPITARSLALRVFVALPGVNLTHDALTFLPDHVVGTERAAPVRVNRMPIPTARLQSPRLVLPRNPHEDFDLVRFIAGENAVLVHPSRTEPTVAIYEDCIPTGANRIMADILVDNPAGQTVGFRLGVFAAPLSERLQVDMLGAGEEPSPLRVSDWNFIGPGRRQTVTLTLDPPVASESASLLLATRTPEGVSPDFAWAKFVRPRFETV